MQLPNHHKQTVWAVDVLPAPHTTEVYIHACTQVWKRPLFADFGPNNTVSQSKSLNLRPNTTQFLSKTDLVCGIKNKVPPFWKWDYLYQTEVIFRMSLYPKHESCSCKICPISISRYRNGILLKNMCYTYNVQPIHVIWFNILQVKQNPINPQNVWYE